MAAREGEGFVEGLETDLAMYESSHVLEMLLEVGQSVHIDGRHREAASREQRVDKDSRMVSSRRLDSIARRLGPRSNRRESGSFEREGSQKNLSGGLSTK